MKKKVQFKRKPKRRRACYFLVNKIEFIDYKDVQLLRRFISDRGKIMPKRNTGVSAKWQRKLANAIKISRYTGLIPYCVD